MNVPERRMRIFTRLSIIGLLFILPILALQIPVASADAADGPLLGDRHVAKGVDCGACHRESPPKLVASDVCFSCHDGNYDKLASRTKKIVPNPHEHHNGDLPCEACHHAHKKPEIQCDACHAFNFNPK